MPANSTRLGPGTLTLTPDPGGTTPVPVDFSCQLANAVVSWDKDTDDDITVLCGDTVAGAATYTSTFSGSMLQDLADDAGIVAFSWDNKGAQVGFDFTPNTAAAASVTGILTVDPLDVGSTDDYGVVMQSDFEWNIVGEPAIAFGTGAVLESATA